VVLTPLPLVITANAAVGRRWAPLATGILAGFSAGCTFLIGAIDLTGAAKTTAATAGQSSVAVDTGIMVTAVVAAALASKPLRDRVARVLPIDPDNPVPWVHAINQLHSRHTSGLDAKYGQQARYRSFVHAVKDWTDGRAGSVEQSRDADAIHPAFDGFLNTRGDCGK